MPHDPLDAAAIDELVARYRIGDDGALEQILDALQPELKVLIDRRRLQEADRDDAAQQAVLVLIRCIGGYDPALGTFQAYACSTVARMLRGFGRSLPGLESAKEPTYEMGDECLGSVEVESLLSVAPEAEIVRLYFGIGRPIHSVNQIAAVVSRSPAAVQAAIAESLRWMRARAGV